jgi:hypothetical protein
MKSSSVVSQKGIMAAVRLGPLAPGPLSAAAFDVQFALMIDTSTLLQGDTQ